MNRTPPLVSRMGGFTNWRASLSAAGGDNLDLIIGGEVDGFGEGVGTVGPGD